MRTLLLGLFVASNAVASAAIAGSPSVPLAAAESATSPVDPHVEVGSRGFQPSHVTLGTGHRVVFKRTSDETCATAVAFPSLGIRKELPLNTDVTVELPASAHGEIGFQCGMGMYRGTVIATERTP
jgi:plastocyanin domain-containing protein